MIKHNEFLLEIIEPIRPILICSSWRFLSAGSFSARFMPMAAA